MTREDLIAAVLEDPNVLWELRIGDYKVAGPWARREKQSERDLGSVDGQTVIVQRKEKTRAGGRCEKGHVSPGSFCSRCGGAVEPVAATYTWSTENKHGTPCVFETREKAELFVDLWLSNEGYKLATEWL